MTRPSRKFAPGSTPKPPLRQSNRLATNAHSGSPPRSPLMSSQTVGGPATPHTPRKRRQPKPTASASHHGKLSTNNILEKTVKGLGLKFVPDEWQLQLIQNIHEGSDSILVAGTGYGKSYIFEALALLGVPKNEIVLVICPLKTLEYDQVFICSVLLLYLYLCYVRLNRLKQKASRRLLLTKTLRTLQRHGAIREPRPSSCTCRQRWRCPIASMSFSGMASFVIA